MFGRRQRLALPESRRPGHAARRAQRVGSSLVDRAADRSAPGESSAPPAPLPQRPDPSVVPVQAPAPRHAMTWGSAIPAGPRWALSDLTGPPGASGPGGADRRRTKPAARRMRPRLGVDPYERVLRLGERAPLGAALPSLGVTPPIPSVPPESE
jgi:hypothetical protein